MIALAANGNPELYELLARGEAPIDFIKCPVSPNSREEVKIARRYRPVVLHCWGPPNYSVTRPEIPEPELLRELAATSGTPFVSAHLDYNPPLDGELDPAAVIERAVVMVQRLREISGLEILVENVPWYEWKSRPRWATDPEFIAECLKRSGARLLLDLAHARVAAYQRGEPIEEYLAALPLDEVWEIHVSGPRMSSVGLVDRHMSLAEEDWVVLRHTLALTPHVQIITHEYAGKRPETAHYNEPDGPERLAAELAKLDELRNSGLALGFG